MATSVLAYISFKAGYFDTRGCFSTLLTIPTATMLSSWRTQNLPSRGKSTAASMHTCSHLYTVRYRYTVVNYPGGEGGGGYSVPDAEHIVLNMLLSSYYECHFNLCMLVQAHTTRDAVGAHWFKRFHAAEPNLPSFECCWRFFKNLP